MTSILDAINNSLADSNQNIVTLTNPNYDADLITIQEDIDVSIRIDLKIEKESITGYAFILGDATRGVLGTSRLGIQSTTITVQELTSV